jgi:hypothetical protein
MEEYRLELQAAISGAGQERPAKHQHSSLTLFTDLGGRTGT